MEQAMYSITSAVPLHQMRDDYYSIYQLQCLFYENKTRSDILKQRAQNVVQVDLEFYFSLES